MKYYSNNQKITKASSLLLGALMLMSLVLPLRADSKLSPGVDVIAADFRIAANGVVGTDIYLDPEEVSAALGIESVGRITIASLPDATLGRLKLGSRYVEVGETISARNIGDLKFVPFGNDEIAATFGFCLGKRPDDTVYNCTFYTTKAPNAAPTVNLTDSIPASTGEITVYSGITHLGTLFATDPEGDPLKFDIVSKPACGELKLTDSERGYFTYTSAKDFSGKDSFRVCAVDKYGNRSETKKITLRVVKPSDNEIFADMSGHYACGAVISCIRAGIIDTPAYGELFYPDEYVSRAEFLALAMNAAGYTGFTVSDTGFADDADIPAEYKGCIAAADAFGVIDGIESAEGLRFYPNNQITRAEAAVIISRLTGISDSAVSVFSDNSVPVWAQSAVSGLNKAGIIRGDGNGSVDAYAPVTRGAAVQMISCLIVSD
ncbi:MAG: S-layer homology domain-containing protein [Clostridia bacterium]|nr:S-layer homology domain-containing protein [Clostridia bacterium]